MNISYRWLQQYLPLDQSPEELAEILTGLGLEVGGIEVVDSIPGGLEGVVIGKVLTCEKHPNADRLSLTTVDVGNGQTLPIVCGAPNVEAGQKVLVAPPGTTIHPSGGEPFEIGERKVRGEWSRGMICAEDELGLGTDHSGIVVLPDDAEVGTLAADYYKVERDWVFDIDLTPNRSDATSHLGVADDLAAYLRIHNGYKGKVDRPDVSDFRAGPGKGIEVVVHSQEGCPRYAGLTIRGIEVGPSPRWLQTRLRAIGVRPINNIVDITNFVLHEMGQPLHAFDAAAVNGRKINVRTLPEGTPFVTLDEVERKLNADDLMICDGENKGLCIAGVFGGIGSGVTDKTTEVFLESAHFNPTWIRKTSMRHQLRTEAAKCFEKTTDPAICVLALKRAAMLICELAGGEIVSGIVDIYPKVVEPREIGVRKQRIESLLGVQFEEGELEEIFDALNFEVIGKTGGEYQIAVPTNKADVVREVDTVEEILRVYGINRIPLKPKMSTTFALSERPTLYAFRRMIANFLASLGLNEAMGLSITESAIYGKLHGSGSKKEKDPGFVPVLNTSNISLDIMRPDLVVSALETLAYNQSRQQMAARIFEFGRGYHKMAAGYAETEMLAITLTDRAVDQNWLTGEGAEVSFYTLKKYVIGLIERCGLEGTTIALDEAPFSYGLSYASSGKTIARFGELDPAWLSPFDIRTKVFFAEIHVENLFDAFGQTEIEVSEISRFPAVFRDLAIVIDEKTAYSDVLSIVGSELGTLVTEVGLFDVYRNPDQLGKGKKSYALRFRFEHAERTLTDKDVDKAIKKLTRRLEEQLGAHLR